MTREAPRRTRPQVDGREICGLLAEFAAPEPLVDAARRARREGYRRLDAFSPFPIEELGEAIGFHRTHLPLLVLLGGVAGGLGGYFLQYWVSVLHYPLNVGGRPLHSWPAFIPVTFECVILGAALTAVVGMLALNGLPRPYNPLFNVPTFAMASRDRFFLYIQAEDARFDLDGTRRFLETLAPSRVDEVED